MLPQTVPVEIPWTLVHFILTRHEHSRALFVAQLWNLRKAIDQLMNTGANRVATISGAVLHDSGWKLEPCSDYAHGRATRYPIGENRRHHTQGQPSGRRKFSRNLRRYCRRQCNILEDLDLRPDADDARI